MSEILAQPLSPSARRREPPHSERVQLVELKTGCEQFRYEDKQCATLRGLFDEVLCVPQIGLDSAIDRSHLNCGDTQYPAVHRMLG
jgi:hypothetical protein